VNTAVSGVAIICYNFLITILAYLSAESVDARQYLSATHAKLVNAFAKSLDPTKSTL